MLALAEHDYGDRAKAEEYYRQALASVKGDILDQINDLATQEALKGLSSLREERRNSLTYPTNAEDIDLLDWVKQNKMKRKRMR